MNPLALLKFLPNIVSVIGKLTGNNKITEASEELKNVNVPPEKLQEFTLEMSKLNLQEVLAADDVEKTLLQSEDKFTKRARPFAMYAATLLTGFLIAICGYCLIKKIEIDWNGIASMVALIAPLWGHAIVYSNNRTKEKLA